MLAFEIGQVLAFMNTLLLGDTFDHFEVTELSVTTFATFQIDGTLHPAFYADDPQDPPAPAAGQYARWADLKKHCLAVIRGRRTPLSFRIVFRLPDEEAAALIRREGISTAPEDVHGLFLNCSFREGRLLLTSGASLAGFDPQKAVERAWDAQLSRFLSSLSSAYTD